MFSFSSVCSKLRVRSLFFFKNSFRTPKYVTPRKEIEPSQLLLHHHPPPATYYTTTTHPPRKHTSGTTPVLTHQVARSSSVHSSDRPRSSVHSSTYTVVCIESVFNGVSFVLNQCSYDTCLIAKWQSNSPQKTAASPDAATKSR